MTSQVDQQPFPDLCPACRQLTPRSLAKRSRLSCPVPPLVSHLEQCAQMSDQILWSRSPQQFKFFIFPVVPIFFSLFFILCSLWNSISLTKATSIRANHDN